MPEQDHWIGLRGGNMAKQDQREQKRKAQSRQGLPGGLMSVATAMATKRV